MKWQTTPSDRSMSASDMGLVDRIRADHSNSFGVSIYDLWLNFRDKCLTSSRFQQFTTRFPLTRPVARSRQKELFDIVSGFVYTQILLACVELEVFAKVRRGRTLQELANEVGLGIDETMRLADGAAALRLLSKRNNKYRLGDLGAALLANPGVMAMIRHNSIFYKDLADPVGLLRPNNNSTNLSQFWDYAECTDSVSAKASSAEAYSKLMASSQTLVAREVISAFDFSRFSTMLDIGGGLGAFVIAVAEKHPDIRFRLFDLPLVAEQAATALRNTAIADRVEIFPGSFFETALPKGADLASLVRIIHDHDDQPALQILKAAHDALKAGGTLLVAEPMCEENRNSRVSDAYFNFYLYAMGSGKPRTSSEIKTMLEAAGFERIKSLPVSMPLITSIMIAHKSTG